jgi:hypothetical protein
MWERKGMQAGLLWKVRGKETTNKNLSIGRRMILKLTLENQDGLV